MSVEMLLELRFNGTVKALMRLILPAQTLVIAANQRDRLPIPQTWTE